MTAESSYAIVPATPLQVLSESYSGRPRNTSAFFTTSEHPKHVEVLRKNNTRYGATNCGTEAFSANALRKEEEGKLA